MKSISRGGAEARGEEGEKNGSRDDATARRKKEEEIISCAASWRRGAL